MDEDQTLRLIVVEDSLNEAEAIVSCLRNAGIAVRMQFIEDLDDIEKIVTTDSHDLVFCNIAALDPSLSQVVTAVQKADPNLGVIASHEEEDPELREEALASGARDMVSRRNESHLQQVTQREWKVVQQGRELSHCQYELRESEKRCTSLLDSSRDAITYVHEGMHIYANPVYLDTFGFASLDDIEGTPIMDMVQEKDHEKLKQFLRTYSKGEKRTRDIEIMGMRPNGQGFKAVMEFSPASIDGEPCTQIIIRDQSLNKELESKLKFLTKQDVQTGLFNRPYFMDVLESAVEQSHEDGKSRALLYLEPDNFRKIKENVGLTGVDVVLNGIADILRKILTEHDVTARFGDATFTVLCEISDINQVMALANSIRTAIESQIFDVEGQSITITSSIGITQFGNTEVDGREVISRADLACDLAHKEGGNRVHLHNPVADEQASKEREFHWIKTLEYALNHNSFSLVYQPIAGLHGESTERYEVLLRMADEEGSEVPPSKFIPAADDNGMIVAIDRWVIANSLRVLRERNKTGKDTVLFIKISTKSIADPNMMPWLLEITKKAKVSPDKLVFEVHENMVSGILREAKLFVEELHKVRFGFCLEHFGTSAGSVQMLKHLRANYIKIDGSFMRNLASNQENQAMVKSMNELAQESGCQTIAEFVEDASSLAVLWQCGINYIQGNFLQQPQGMMNYDFEGEED